MKEKLSPYYPGIILFVVALVIGFLTYKDYGVAWDEPMQRVTADLNYNYAFHGDNELFLKPTDNHGTGFEMPLIMLEKNLHLTDKRIIYQMRHLITHILFLVSAFFFYVLSYKLFKNKFLASLGFLLIVCAPRMYAHSYFNSKDIPFLSFIIITLTAAVYTFEHKKSWKFLVLGLLVGYTTSIRIMGVMLGFFFILFWLIDLFTEEPQRKPAKSIVDVALFCAGLCFAVYITWPYLWKNPVHHFTESFGALANFNWNGGVLVGGKYYDSTKLPWTYFFTWFFISNPILWLIAGLSGIGLAIYAFFQRPLHFIKNTPERNFLLYLLCFFAPIFAIYAMHSVIYDDWRHLYFIYPPFALLALYAIHTLLQNKTIAANKKLGMAVQAACLVQVGASAFFMVKSHPFQQVYFNALVSHDEEYLRKNYEMDYWGVSNLQALKYILENDQRNQIMVTTIFPELLQNNIDILDDDDRKRVKLVHPDSSDYFITNFRFHPDDFPMKEEYSFQVLNSTVIRIYRQKDIGIKLR
jgi:hypothetical protein